jgi:hypothetical protein
MKLHDFGLWFTPNMREWSTTIPQKRGFDIYYDGMLLGRQHYYYELTIDDDKPHIIKLKNKFSNYNRWYCYISRPLTLDDFEIIPNPDYKGVV